MNGSPGRCVPGCLLLLCVFFVSGCVLPPRRTDLDAFLQRDPRSIVVPPVLNQTTNLDATTTLTSLLSEPIAERGYYVFPIHLTESVLRDIGLPEAGLAHQLPPHRFAELFGADSVLFITIEDWGTSYSILSADVEVKLLFVLFDTRSGAVLWKAEGIARQESEETNLLGVLIEAAVNSIYTDYEPLARQAIANALSRYNAGMPVGPYHPQFTQERARLQ